MSLIACPECKKRISEKAESCPKCGIPLDDETRQRIKAQETQNLRLGCGSSAIIMLLLSAFLKFQGIDCSGDERPTFRSSSGAASAQAKAFSKFRSGAPLTDSDIDDLAARDDFSSSSSSLSGNSLVITATLIVLDIPAILMLIYAFVAGQASREEGARGP